MAGKHRAEPKRINWRSQVWYLKNRWYVFVKPQLKAELRKIFRK